MPNPVYQNEGGQWFFKWNKVEHGPYNSDVEAWQALRDYKGE